MNNNVLSIIALKKAKKAINISSDKSISVVTIDNDLSLGIQVKKLNSLTGSSSLATYQVISKIIDHYNSELQTKQNKIELLENKINSTAALFNITFDEDGNIVSEDYTLHTHTP